MSKIFTTKEIQSKILEIFKVFQSICKKHNLTYFAIGGTCLGAVRHKGFIPWDDDMDVAMPYQDYKKFQQIAKKELPPSYEILDPYLHKHWSNGFIKIHDKQTTFIEEKFLPYLDTHTGVFLDIMPVFALPQKRWRQKWWSFKLNVWLHQNSSLHYPFREMKSKADKFWWYGSFHYRLFFPYYHLIEKIERQLGKLPFNCSDKIVFAWRMRPFTHPELVNYKQIFEYKDFASTMEVPFEDTTISIPIGYDNYLKMDFGDYMKLPPEEKRHPGHETSIIDLENPYSYYQRRNEK